MSTYIYILNLILIKINHIMSNLLNVMKSKYPVFNFEQKLQYQLHLKPQF